MDIIFPWKKTTQDSSGPFPYFTILLGALCVIVSFGIWSINETDSWQQYEKWGYYSSESIWNGAYWAYITSCFIHSDLIHLVFNVYWLFTLGKYLEPEIGLRKIVLLFICLAVISSGFEFWLSEETGVGMSGVLYGLFGFMWVARSRYPIFRQIVTLSLAKLFIGWLVLCYVLTYLKIWDVGNMAHLSGLISGLLIGVILTHKKFLAVSFPILAGLMFLAITPMFWFPSSLDWVCFKAYTSQDKKHNGEALKWYSKAIQMDSENAWAYYNRSVLYKTIGDKAKAAEDYKKAVILDPSFAEDTSKNEK